MSAEIECQVTRGACGSAEEQGVDARVARAVKGGSAGRRPHRQAREATRVFNLCQMLTAAHNHWPHVPARLLSLLARTHPPTPPSPLSPPNVSVSVPSAAASRLNRLSLEGKGMRSSLCSPGRGRDLRGSGRRGRGLELDKLDWLLARGLPVSWAVEARSVHHACAVGVVHIPYCRVDDGVGHLARRHVSPHY
eukprot:2122585-Rhodomonas_salina.1